MCLLSNAVKYSTAGKVTISVSKVKRELKRTKTAEMLENTIRISNRIASTEFESRVVSTRGSLTSKVSLDRISFKMTSSHKILPGVEEELGISVRSVQGGRDSFLQEHSVSKSLSTFLRFEVEDEGIGLDPKVMNSLFNPFTQAQRLAGGTGTDF